MLTENQKEITNLSRKILNYLEITHDPCSNEGFAMFSSVLCNSLLTLLFSKVRKDCRKDVFDEMMSQMNSAFDHYNAQAKDDDDDEF